MDQPLVLSLEVLELRAYRDAKHQVEQAKDPKDIPQSAAIDLVFQVQALRMKRKREEVSD